MPTANKPPPADSTAQQTSGQGSRIILQPRPPKSKAGHERKRTKLSTDTTPFDNVDYWIQFDNEDGGVGEGNSPELSHQKVGETQHLPLRETQHQQPQQQPQQRSEEKQQR